MDVPNLNNLLNKKSGLVSKCHCGAQHLVYNLAPG